MRQIKFRAWVEKQKYMAYQGTPDLETIQSFMFHYGDQILMQYTGIKDNEENEIYEGDIVDVYGTRYVVKFGKVIREVVLQNNNATCMLELNTFYFEWVCNGKAYFSVVNNHKGEHDLKGTKIVGNIFENENLLKELNLNRQTT